MVKRIGCALLMVGLVASQLGAAPRPPREHGGDIPWQALEQAEKRPRDRPMLVYFGAQWCGPCKMLETSVFNQPDIGKALQGVIPVYIDGDASDAIALMERFKVVAFPSLLLIKPDGRESARLVGSAEKGELLEFLQSNGSQDSPPALLERVVAGATLDARQWALLASLPISDASEAQYQNQERRTATEVKRGNLAKALAASRRQPGAGLATQRLAMKLLAIDAATGNLPRTSRRIARISTRCFWIRPRSKPHARSSSTTPM